MYINYAAKFASIWYRFTFFASTSRLFKVNKFYLVTRAPIHWCIYFNIINYFKWKSGWYSEDGINVGSKQISKVNKFLLWRLHYYINRYINVSTKYTQRLTQTKVTTSSVEYRKRRKVKEKVYKNNLIDFYQEQKISTDKSVQHKKKVFHFHPFVMIKKRGRGFNKTLLFDIFYHHEKRRQFS